MTRPKSQPRVRFGNYVTTHGMTATTEYCIWSGIVKRCTNPKTKIFPFYGGRGIKVCHRWMKFENFYADMGPRPSKSHSIDRKHNDGDYEPSNCRWATRQEQMGNRRGNMYITMNGQTLCCAEWARRLGLQDQTIRRRVKLGQTGEQALRPSRLDRRT